MIDSRAPNGGMGAPGGNARWCTPMYRTLPSFFISLRTAKPVETSPPEPSMTRSILETLNFVSFSSTAALTVAGSAFGGGPDPGAVGTPTDSGVVQKNLS
jgi:hypothetical protein